VPILRSIEPEDLGFLYSLAARWPESWHRVCRRGIPFPEEFDSLLRFNVNDQFMVEVEVNEERRRVGLVALFDADYAVGTAWIDSVGLPGDANDPLRAKALDQLIDRAFIASPPLRKIYVRHHGFEACPLSHLPYRTVEEARLTDHVRHDDFLWDSVITALHRADWRASGAIAP
jgi:hypothetical protein